MSHGGSGKQARSVIDGLEADVVTLALQNDIDLIAKETGKIPADWRTKLPSNSSPYTSTIVFIVRKGNPKNIRDWGDLALPGVSRDHAQPQDVGRRALELPRGLGLRRASSSAGDEAKIREFVGAIYKNVAKLDTGARGSTTTFTQQGTGDVLITWENEAFWRSTSSAPTSTRWSIPRSRSRPSRRSPSWRAMPTSMARGRWPRTISSTSIPRLGSGSSPSISIVRSIPSQADPADLARFKPIEMLTIDDPISSAAGLARSRSISMTAACSTRSTSPRDSA